MSQNAHSKLGRKQTAAIAALLQSGSVEEAAAACGVSRSTLARWQADPSFKAAYEVSAKQLVEYAAGRLRAGADTALSTLHGAMTSTEDVPVSVKVRAADSWLNHVARLEPLRISATGEGLFDFMRLIAERAMANVADIVPSAGLPPEAPTPPGSPSSTDT